MIKIEDLKQGDELTIFDDASIFIGLGADKRDMLLLDKNSYEIEDVSIEDYLNKATAWSRAGKDMLKKELVPVCSRKWTGVESQKQQDIICILRAIRGLKVALKDNSEYVCDKSNNVPYFYKGNWIMTFASRHNDYGLPTFTDASDSERQQVLDYLNKNFKSGWKV